MLNDRFETNMDPEEFALFMAENNLDADVPDQTPPPPKPYVAPPRTIVVARGKDAVRAAQMLKNKDTVATKRIATGRQAQAIKRQLMASMDGARIIVPLTKVEKQLIIERLTMPANMKVEKLKTKLTKLIESKLRQHIPRGIRAAFDKDPKAFAQYPGFMYTSTAFFGHMQIHLKPNLPPVFAEVTEMDIIKFHCEKFRYTYDRMLEMYYLALKHKIRDETLYAVRVNKAKSILDLLDLGLAYYEAYKEITDYVELR